MRRDLASALRDRTHDLAPPPPAAGAAGARRRAALAGADDEIAGCATQLRAHPCHGCAEREDHARWAERWFKLDRDAATLRRRVERRTNTVARQFDRVCEVLPRWATSTASEVDRARPAPDAASTPRSTCSPPRPAARAVGRPVRPPGWPPRCRRWSSRPAAPTTPRPRGCPAAPVRHGDRARWCGCGPSWTPWSASTSWTSCASPTSGFAWAAYRWAEGDDLDDVLGDTDLAAGDFVRWMKQLLDLAGQVADAAGEATWPAAGARAGEAVGPAAPRASSPTRVWPRYVSASAQRGQRLDEPGGRALQAPLLGERDHAVGVGRGARAACGRGAVEVEVARDRDHGRRDRQVVRGGLDLAARARAHRRSPGRRPRRGCRPGRRSAASRVAAVFSPTPATPGSPSEGSPRRAAKSAYCAAARRRTSSRTQASVDPLVAAPRPCRCRARAPRRRRRRAGRGHGRR